MGLISVLLQAKRHQTLPLVVGVFFTCTLAFSADPAQYEHENPGCQINSLCDKQTGLKRLAWIKSVKTKNMKRLNQAIKQGQYPLGIWFIGEKSPSTILWKSVCHTHRGKGIKMGKLFISKLKQVNQFKNFTQDNFLFTDLVTYQHGNKSETFVAPINESPSSIHGGNMVYTLGEMGNIYTISISSQGEIKAIRADSEYHPTYATPCPKKLSALTPPLPKEFPLKISTYCRSIWNETLKKYDTIMVHSFCP